MTELAPLDRAVLPAGIRSRFVPGINGLRVHVLEAGFEQRGRPCVLLLHGFPEIAYSWRRIMPALAAAGFHVVAPDQRGYGRTTGWDADYDGDLRPFRILNAVRDALGLVSALGHSHGRGGRRPRFRRRGGRLVRAGAARRVPLAGADERAVRRAAALPFDTAEAPPPDAAPGDDIHAALAKLDQPRKHYQWYYSTRPANAEMWHCPQGVHAFLRGYFHYKSADWTGNRPHPLQSWSAGELAKMPTYYIMDFDRNMAETVAPVMPSAAEIACVPMAARARACGLRRRIRAGTGFRAGSTGIAPARPGSTKANCSCSPAAPSMCRRCSSPARSDWGTYQRPGAFERMQSAACTRMRGVHLIDGAGHWVQQEQPEQVGELLLEFLRRRD